MNKKYQTKLCEVCDKPFQKRGRTCSSKCANELRRKSSNIIKKCSYCGKDFKATHKNDKFCKRKHYKKCVVCSKEFEIKNIHRISQTCSSSCATALGHNEESNKKRIENSIKKWGVDYPFQAESVKNKIKGSPTYQKNLIGGENFNKKIKEKYGVDNVSQSEIIKEKKKETSLKKYGVDNPFKNPIIRNRYKETMISVYGEDAPYKIKSINNKATKTFLKNIASGKIKYNRISKINCDFGKILEESFHCHIEYEYFLEGNSFDLLAEKDGRQLLIELNPTVSHNTYRSFSCLLHNCQNFPCEKHKTIDKNYHFNRAKLAHDKGFQLINVFDWMDKDKIIDFIGSKLHHDVYRVGARECIVKELTQKEANNFLKKFHLMGGSIKQLKCYGLFYHNKLLQVQTFSHGKKEEWEAKRLATRKDWYVIGGISKITKHFIKDVNPQSIVAFSDLNLSWPNFDSNYNGFKIDTILKPQKCWSKGNKMILAKNAAFQSADRLIGISNNSKDSKYPGNWNNDQVFIAEGWLPVWDCGMLREVWQSKNFN